MSTRVVDRVDDWEERSFTGGYRELHELADSEFSGVVRAGGAELYMTKGVVVGVRQGDIEDFEDGRGTVYEAPSPALPLLAIMQDRGGDDARDQFYTEKTAISEVDSTLSDGGFTGFIELSENVLSGDYYLVYQAGRSMSVGFVGESARLIDGDEAFETADDEVGIYKVHAVDIEPIEIPEPAASGGSSTGGAVSEDASSTTAEPAAPTAATGDESPEPSGTESTAAEAAETESATEAEPAGTDRASEAEDDGPGATARGPDAGEQRQTTQGSQRQEAEPREREEPGRDQEEQQRQQSDASQKTTEGRQRQQTGGSERGRGEGTKANQESEASRTGTGQTAGTPQRGGAQPETGQQRQGTDHPGQGQQADWDQDAARGRAPPEGGRSAAGDEGLDLEQRAIPSLDPDRTAESDSNTTGSARDSLERSRGQTGQQTQPSGTNSDRRGAERGAPPTREQSSDPATGTQQQTTTQQPQETTAQQSQQTPTQQPQGTSTQQSQQPQETTTRQSQQTPTQQPQGASTQQPGVDPERIEELESEVDEREAEIDRLEDELASATSERDDLREELESVREERDELKEEVDRLEADLSQLEEELGAATDAERRITSEEALSGTDIFFRYHSKGDATLEKAHGGSTRQEDVNENLRLEKHTQFDADTVAVGGQSYAEYLEETVEYQFVEWLVRELLFEIRETGHQKELKGLYDVLAAVDRAELSGVVDVVYTADGQETRSQEAFDIILRDRMGNPLLVANLNDSREAATESMMEDLITAAERVGQSVEQFAGAFLVTRSFFDPGALEVAEEATQGGLLSRDKRKSFVNLSRKRGYHLCLVEARNENFHLAVPEL